MGNKVELIGQYGNDTIIACSAWTSTSRNLDEEKRKRIPKMLKDLWSNGHETPFEKGVVHFLVDTEIASHIHFLKHRISSFNGESARYKELKEDKYYLPSDWDHLVQKPIEQKFGCLSAKVSPRSGITWTSVLEDYNDLGNMLYHQSLEELTPVLGRKRAKESCRFFKTYSSQIEGDVSFNMRSFANFIKLRKSESAQKEIREIATEMLELVKSIPGEPFKYTLEAINYG